MSSIQKVAKAPIAASRWWWLVWLVASISIAVYLGIRMLGGEQQQIFMPGPLSNGHHQLDMSCGSCHLSPMGGGEVLQQSCIDCHGDERKKPDDSHPISKFEDPRNASRLQQINALECTTCHTEHRPEITAKNGVTMPVDFCVHCHEDIGEERESHSDMEFATCASAGCHNYHNNRAIYTDFLLKHMHQPDLLEKAVLPEREFAAVLDQLADYPHDNYPVAVLSIADADHPQDLQVSAEVLSDWSASAHAQAGANCSSCHALSDNKDNVAWHTTDLDTGCVKCHSNEVERFGRGKHGMRLSAGLAPMTPADARLPMKPEAAHSELGCHSCHQAHDYDTRSAAVDACLTCHNDDHSLAYLESPHFALWQAELTSPEAKAGSGVSCASCHMPRVDFDVSEWVSRTIVDHNQNANLSPNTKMIRGTCLHCHGLEFSINALSDPALVNNNFSSQPSVVIDSMRLARELEERDQLRRQNN